ncbi:MAG TPA: hypothetical protein VNF47_23530 [Streptosporangiaceae bacterium]|nr:hypothetical protein [Streptosporangiaceae bacterium]
MAAAVTPPGKAHVIPCPDCKGIAGQSCYECHGDGRLLMRACPLCGDLGWDYINGIDDRQGMACRLACGYRWTADDAAWRAQVLPSTTP